MKAGTWYEKNRERVLAKSKARYAAKIAALGRTVKAFGVRVAYACKGCGAELYASPGRVTRKKFCTQACYRRHSPRGPNRKRRSDWRVATLECAECGVLFNRAGHEARRNYRLGHQTYCTPSCAQAGAQRKNTRHFVLGADEVSRKRRNTKRAMAWYRMNLNEARAHGRLMASIRRYGREFAAANQAFIKYQKTLKERSHGTHRRSATT